ncbi:MAG: DUF5011 domain-containing protein [bacterium]|nr:DUF5011 domain-containing protein [bacterium]
MLKIMSTRTVIFLGLLIFLSSGQTALASTIFSQTPRNETLNGPILNSPYLLMFGCLGGLNYCGVYGKTVYNIGVWIKKIGNPADIRLQVVDTWTHYPTGDTSNFSNSVSASSASSTAYTLKWFYFPNGVVIGNKQFFLFQFTGANNTSSTTNYYRALYDPNNSYNAPQQWCQIYKGCPSSKFFWMMDDENIDLSLPPLPTIAILGSATTTAEFGSTFTDPGATAHDDIDGDLTSAIRVTGSINTNIIGTTTLTYAVTNSQGFSATTTRAVVVACTHDCYSNVLFLPGIEGSRLYRPDYDGGTDQLWEPNIDSDVQDLYMNADGTSARNDVYVKEKDVIDELPSGANIYKSFIAKMDELETSAAINDWEPISYDWRLSLDDILDNGRQFPDGRIYYSGDLAATSSPYIIQELRRLAKNSKTGKVTIVAHSNGGLLAKRLTEILGPTESARLIDKMIFVAVPQAGTPMAIPAGLHGYEQDHVLGLVTSKPTARTFAQNSPMEYQLLPSTSYFTYVDDPVITFDASLTDWITRYGATIHSKETLHAFLIDSYGRVNAQTDDINQPIQFNSSLLSNAETLHTSLDNWTAPSGVQLIQIAGWGVPKTVEGITYKKKGEGVTPEADFTIDGDGTVIVPSALWTSTSTGAVNYWVNLRNYNANHPFLSAFDSTTFNHSRILEPTEVLNFLSDQITNTTKPLIDYIYLSTEAPPASDKRLRYALHSPLTLNLYDNQGRHTGVSTSTGQVEEQIPGTYYTEFGDVKYLFSDADTSAHILMDGYASGTFTFNIDQYSGDTVTASTTFKDIPTTASTKVSLDVQSDISTLSSMQIDKNGDGVIDVTLTPKLGEAVYEPPAPAPEPAPEPAVSSAGSRGGGGRRVATPVTAPVPVAPTTNIPTIITQPVVTNAPDSTSSPQATKPVQVKKVPVAIAPPKKVNTIVPQTASVYQAFQQSVLTWLGNAVYNILYGFWVAFKSLF